MMRARLLLVLCAIGLCLALGGVAQAQLMTDVTDPSDRVEGTSQNYPGGTSPDGPEGGEAPRNSINNVVESKYLNFDKENSGFVVTLDTAGPASLSAIILTTANDSPDRDPASVTIMGTNDDIVFDDMPDEGINWFPIVADLATPLSDDRFAEAGPFEFTPITDGAFASYMVTFPTLKDSATANSMQIGEVQLSGIAAVPEPTSLVLLLIGAAGLFVWRRGR